MAKSIAERLKFAADFCRPRRVEVTPKLLDDAVERIENLENWIRKESHCPSANGFEGPETFPDCGVCIYCLLKENPGD